jgi:hypothetical protein
MLNPETETYEFPITLYNRTGGEYAVNSLDELRYHQDNGWSIEVPEQDVPAIITSVPEHLNNLGVRFRDLEKAHADMLERFEALEKKLSTTYSSLVTAHKKIAELGKGGA